MYNVFLNFFDIFKYFLTGYAMFLPIIVVYLPADYSRPVFIIMTCILFIFGIIVSFVMLYKRKKVYKVGNHCKVEIVYGDIFDYDNTYLKIIPADKELTEEIDDIKIAKNSIQGKYFERYKEKYSNQKKIQEGNYYVYPFVKIINNKASLTPKKYVDEIFNLLEKIDEIQNSKSIVMPLVGSGQLRIDLKDEQILKTLLYIIEMKQFKKKTHIIIVLYNKKQNPLKLWKFRR